jgi:hypothetical protein
VPAAAELRGDADHVQQLELERDEQRRAAKLGDLSVAPRDGVMDIRVRVGQQACDTFGIVRVV